MRKRGILLRVLAIYLCLCLLSGCAPAKTRYFRSGQHGKTAFQDMRYVHYDAAPFYTKIEEMLSLCDGKGTGEKIVALYDELYGEYEKIYTNACLALIFYYQSPTDADAEKETQYADSLNVEASDRLCTAVRTALRSRNGAALREHIGTAAARELLLYEDMTPRELEINDEETALVNEYQRLMVEMDVSVELFDESWSYAKLETDWKRLSGDQQAQIEAALEKALNERAGDIYIKLAALRSEYAAIGGYANYSDCAYTEAFSRDYTPEEAAAFANVVRQGLGPRYFQEIAANEAVSAGGTPKREISPARALDTVGKYARAFGSEVYDVYRYMKKYKLYDIHNDQSKIDGGFSVDLPAYDSLFLYNRAYGSESDVSDTAHEFGHCLNFYYNPTKNFLATSESYDICEVHSTAMSCLLSYDYEDIYGKRDAPAARAYQLSNVVSSIIYGCIMDEFQQYVYAHPGMTLTELNRLYHDIKQSYGWEYEAGDGGEDYEWMYVNHNFEQPMYYVSYATSALTALTFWDMAEADMEGAREAYLKFTSFGAADFGYLELLGLCGLSDFRDADYVERTVGGAMDAIVNWVA